MEFLFVEEQPMAGRECLVSPGMTVGREGCDHVLADPEVSRTHATFRGVDAQLGVEDSGSTNGTFVNDVRASGIQVLVPGDRLRFGHTVWRFERASESRVPAAATVHAQVPAPPARATDPGRARPRPDRAAIGHPFRGRSRAPCPSSTPPGRPGASWGRRPPAAWRRHWPVTQ